MHGARSLLGFVAIWGLSISPIYMYIHTHMYIYYVFIYSRYFTVTAALNVTVKNGKWK